MTPHEVNGFRTILDAKRRDLEGAIRRRDGIAVERAAEDTEQAILSAERELAISQVDHASRMLRDVRGAIARIAEGTFGECQECGDNQF